MEEKKLSDDNIPENWDLLVETNLRIVITNDVK